MAAFPLQAYDIEHYMQCPGPIVDGLATGECGEVIPKVINCTGPNYGKRCQRCNACSYFVWLPFENSGSPSPGLQRSGNITPRHQQAFSPLRNDVNVGLNMANSIPIDPALGGFNSTTSRLPAQPAGSLAGRSKEKKSCTSRPCSRLATATCSKAMCKTCCIRDVVAICFNKAHNSGRRPVSTSDDPFHLARPVPSIPLRLPTSTDTSGFDFSALSFVSPSLPSLPTLSIPPGAVDPPALTPSSTGETETNPFYFGKPVPSALVADWNRRKQEREARQKSETSRMENERRIKHTVLLVAYLEDMAEPIPLPLQDINTWPTLNLAHLPHLVAQLGVQKLDELELYVRSNHGCFWIPNPDHSMSVKTDEKVFIRRKGVKTPSLPSTFVNAMAQYDSPSRSAPISSRKRTRESSASPPLMPRCLKFPRVDIDLTDDSDTQQGSPLPVPLSPSPSPLPSRPQLPQPTSCDLDQDLQVDRIWLSGCVHTPTDITGVVWPQRLYARDMVQGFALLQDATGNADLSLNRKFWSKLPAHLREEARVLPRTPSGLWTVWRKTQPGWN